MFTFKNNLILLTRYAKRTYKSRSVFNKLSLAQCHQVHFSSKKNLSSHTPDQNTLNVKDPANSSKEEQDNSNQLPSELEAITKGDKELEYKLKVIMLETEVLRQEGLAIPKNEFMTPLVWENLLKFPSRNGRMKYLNFMFRISKKKENRLAKKLEKRKQFEEVLANREELPKNIPLEEHAIKYGLIFNSIFLRIYDATINHLYNRRLIQAIQFGQKLVIDCGYDQNMTKRENNNTAKQLMLLFSENRNNVEPFDIHYTNINKESDLIKMLHKYMPTMYDKEFPMNIHEKSYLELFPKQKLIYLTPHCREEMDSYDHDAVYIIGAIVDKVNNEPLSLAKAKREGITMKKFPLDRYLQWNSGSGKSLTINQCVAILLDLKETNDWNYALRHVPRRKLVDPTTVYNSFKPSNKTRFVEKRSTWKPNRDKSTFRVRNLCND